MVHGDLMNDNESKVPIYIAILVALLIVAAGGYYLTSGSSIGGSSEDVPPETHEAPVDANEEEDAPKPAHENAVEAAPKPIAEKRVETIKCELCHTGKNDALKVEQHVNGGKLCINCHGSQVHNIHIGQGTIGLNCDTCHGFPPSIPTVEKGEGPGSYTVCEQCHAAPPNSLEPSMGNLIVVHLSRGKYCTNCHGNDIATVHMNSMGN